MSKPPSKSSSKLPSKTSSKASKSKTSKDSARQLTLEDQERIRQEEVLSRLGSSGCVCGGTGVSAHGQTMVMEAELCRRSVRKSKDTETPPSVWEVGPALATPRWHCCAAAVGHGRMLVVGGFDEFGVALDSTELVNFVLGTVQPGPKLLLPRAGSAAVSLPLPLAEDEQEMLLPWVLVVGGYGQDAGVSTEVLDLNEMKSSPGFRLLSRRACCVASMYGEDEVVVAGGFDEFASVSSTEFIHLFNLKPTAVAEPLEEKPRLPGDLDLENEEVPLHAADLGRAFPRPGPEMLERRAACAAVAVFKLKQDREGRDKVWIIGGTNEKGQRLQSSEWIEVVPLEPEEEDLPEPVRTYARRASRRESRLYLASHPPQAAQAQAAQEDEDEDAADAEDAPGDAREAHGEGSATSATGSALDSAAMDDAEAVEAADGASEAEIEGHESVKEVEPEVESKGKSLRKFQQGPKMTEPRSGLAAVRLNEAVVLVAGGVGVDGSYLDSTEFFDFEDRKEVLQPGPSLSAEGNFGYCAAGRAVVDGN